MASARTYYSVSLRVFVIVLFLLSLTLSLSISVDDESSVGENKKILGSRPPGCVNKCVNCRPCQATLVIPPHSKFIDSSHWEDNYYLLSWKCKCGDKIFQP
ncbi:hypothetical protein Lser_V15G17726 [Lactuca serriola]